MYHFLDTLYFITYDDDLGGYLGSAALYSANQGECPQTMDAAIWDDWMNAIKVILNDNSITYNFQLTTEQAHAAMHQYLVTYCAISSEPIMKILRDSTDTNIKSSKNFQWLNERWKQSLEFILHDDPYKKIGHFFTGKSGLNNHASFAIMQIFLNFLCRQNNDPNLIRLVQNSRQKDRNNYWADGQNIIDSQIWYNWQQAIDIILQQNYDSELNLLVAYKAIPLFLINYFNKNQEKIVKDFEIQDDSKPQFSLYWRSWTSAAVELKAYCTEIENNSISINTSISENLSFKIIQTWFKEYEALLDFHSAQAILADTSSWQKAINNIKQKSRSYLLLDDEVTVLETYQIMINLLEFANQKVDAFEIDPQHDNKPKDFVILLNWIRICEQIIIKK